VASSGKDCHERSGRCIRPGQDVALHGAFDVFFCSAGHKIQLGIKGEELEEVAMGFAGRTGPAITDFPKSFAALARNHQPIARSSEILRQGAQIRGQVKDHPCTQVPHRSVRDRRASKRNI